jgi:hypothetical protein
MWSSDHWRLIKRNIFRKVLLGLQILVLLALFVYFLR